MGCAMTSSVPTEERVSQKNTTTKTALYFIVLNLKKNECLVNHPSALYTENRFAGTWIPLRQVYSRLPLKARLAEEVQKSPRCETRSRRRQ